MPPIFWEYKDKVRAMWYNTHDGFQFRAVRYHAAAPLLNDKRLYEGACLQVLYHGAFCIPLRVIFRVI